MASAIHVATRDSSCSLLLTILFSLSLSLTSSVDDATLFSVEYKNNYKIVKNSKANVTYVLTQCGTPAPSPAGFSNTTVFFEVPLKNVASITTTSVAYLEMLGERVAIKAVDTEGLVSSPCVQLGLEQNEIIGLEDKNATLRAQQLNAVDLIFDSYLSDPSSANKTVITNEVNDPGPLNVSCSFFFLFFSSSSSFLWTTKQSHYMRIHPSEKKNEAQTPGSWTLLRNKRS